MNSISFVNPWLLFLIIPAAAVITVPFVLAVRSDNRNGHNIASFVLHILMAVIIAFAAAGTTIVTVITETEVFVVADVSYSANKNLDTVDGYINNLQNNLPRNSKLGIVCFAKDYKVLTELGEEVKSVKYAEIDDTETNIAGALEYTGKLFRENVIKRIVLITDGRQSDLRSSDNTLKRTVDNLALSGVRVDAIYLDDNLDENAKEIQVTSAEFTKTAFLNGENNTVTALVQSSYNALNMTVSLYSNDLLIESKIVNLPIGYTPVTFTLPSNVKGEFDYEIRVDGLQSDEDYCTFNNKISFTQTVSDAVSVLLVTENAANEAYIKGIYGEQSEIDARVVTEGSVIPVTVEELCVYDEIVLADVDLKKLDSYKIFIDSLDKVVSVFGKNLVTVGDLAIQNTQDSGLKQLNDMLPVRFGYNDNDPKLYTVVIDTSRSMETNNRLIMAKEAARRIANLLGENDMYCLVEFNGDVRVALDPTEAGKTEKINNAIDNLGVLQGTLIYKGLDEAYKQIASLTMYKEKQVMLITDGLTYSTGEGDDPVTVANNMRADNIKISVIDVGRGGDYDTSETAKRAVQLMKDISGWDLSDNNPYKGDYFYAISPESLAEIFLSEIADNITEPIINAQSTVIRNRRTDPSLDGFDEDAGTIGGLINNSAKGSATTVLKAEYFKDAANAYVQAPLYSYWSYGNGKVSSFTSDISNGWTDGWNNKEVFFKNVFETSVPASKTDKPYLTEVSSEGKFGRVSLTPINLYAETSAQIVVTAPDGSVATYEAFPDSTGFHADFEASLTGKYSIAINYFSDGVKYDSVTSLNVSYFAEYDMFANFDASELYKSVGGNGTVSEDGNLKIENDIREVGTYEYSLTVILLSVAAVLFVADIIIRKLKWNDIKNLFVKVNKNK
ncbi:MAG: VWA domain-containing protein [Clostridia bacterium]|nr:VWA domain-containing protein [Clostridia bacterium]